MNRKSTIVLFYTGIAILSLLIVGTALMLRSRLPEPDLDLIVDSGKTSAETWFPLTRDLTCTNQDGQTVRLSDLRGKVWIAAEFFAVCPHCAVRNGEELRKIYDEFRAHPDFQIVCISIDPEQDDTKRLADYASALGADSKNWWFLNAGDERTTHEYLEREMKFFSVRERTDPADIEANGRFSHDLGFIMVDRDMRVIGKWPLAEARSEEARKRDPEMYDRLKQDMFDRIRSELSKVAQP
jgi:protein SCO1/2